MDYYKASYGKNLQFYFIFLSERDASSDMEVSTITCSETLTFTHKSFMKVKIGTKLAYFE